MGRFLRQARLYHDARRPDRRADRGPGVAVLRRASARGARLSLPRGTDARAAAARIGGTGPQPLARAADSPPSRAVPVGLQPLQGACGGAAPGYAVEGDRLADPDNRCRSLDAASLAPCPARSDRLRSRFAPVHPWTRAAQGLSDQSFSLLAGDDGKRACRTRQGALPRLWPKRPRTLDSVVGAARARDAPGENCRTRADPSAQGEAPHPARAALRRPGRRLHAPDLRNRLGGDLREAEGPYLRRAAPLGENALRAPARDIPTGGRAPGARRAEGGDPVLLSPRSGLRAPRCDLRPVLRGLRRDDHWAFAHGPAHRRPRAALRDAHAAGRRRLRAALLSGLGGFSGRRRRGRRAANECLHRGARARNARAVLLDAQALQNTTRSRTEVGLKFTKMQGAGNDFVVIDGATRGVEITPERARRIADRHLGVGCDQVLLVEKSQRGDADFRYRIWNADGGEVEQCGNGARCFVRFVHDKGLTKKNEIRVETLSGIIAPRLEADGQVTVDMGKPLFDPERIPFNAGGLQAVRECARGR